MQHTIFYLCFITLSSFLFCVSGLGVNISYTLYNSEGCMENDDILSQSFIDGDCIGNSLNEYQIVTVVNADIATLW